MSTSVLDIVYEWPKMVKMWPKRVAYVIKYFKVSVSDGNLKFIVS